MPFEITMPQLGLTMEEGAVIEWLVHEGDDIQPGQEVLQVESDKSVMAVEARSKGTLARILVPAGQTVPVGAVLAVGLAEDERLPEGWQAPSTGTEPKQAAPVESASVEPGPRSPMTLVAAELGAPLQASWKARTMAREAGIDLQGLAGTGPGGRVTAEDIAGAGQHSEGITAADIQATPVAANLAAALGLDLSTMAGRGASGQITRADVLAAARALIGGQLPPIPAPEPGHPQVASATPLRGVRKIVSQGMAASVRATARVTLFREVDASGLAHLRQHFGSRGLAVSYNDLLIRICAIALAEHPQANARLGEGQVELLDRINIGLAVDTERGLLVPVIHGADRLTIPQIAAQTASRVQAVRAGQSLPDDLAGGTFTITNLGMLGVEGFTPVINLPECCILGVGRIVRKPVVIDDADTVAVRPLMTISLVFDHRVIDGAPAARFLDHIARLIEDPLLILVENES